MAIGGGSGNAHQHGWLHGRVAEALAREDGRILYLTRRVLDSDGPPPHPDDVADHIDLDSTNDHPSNLRWVSRSKNSSHQPKWDRGSRSPKVERSKYGQGILLRLRSDDRKKLEHLKQAYGTRSLTATIDQIVHRVWESEHSKYETGRPKEEA